MATAPMPSCTMKIFMSESHELVAESVKIGDRLSLAITIDYQGKGRAVSAQGSYCCLAVAQLDSPATCSPNLRLASVYRRLRDEGNKLPGTRWPQLG